MNKNKTSLMKVSSFSRGGTLRGNKVGLEIECEGTDLPSELLSHFNVHEDHSLRNVDGDPPREYVLKSPHLVSEIPKAIKYLNRKLDGCGAEVLENSPRTSVHVHINVSDLRLTQVFAMLSLYTLYEEALVGACGHDRVCNLFCLRAVDSAYNFDKIRDCLNGGGTAVFSRDYRYLACNLAPLSTFGSMEFRSLHGTTDEGVIVPWVNVLSSFRSVVEGKDAMFASPLDVSHKFKELGPSGFYNLMLGSVKDIDTFIKPTSDTLSSMCRGHNIILDAAYQNEWPTLDELISSDNKASGEPGAGSFVVPNWINTFESSPYICPNRTTSEVARTIMENIIKGGVVNLFGVNSCALPCTVLTQRGHICRVTALLGGRHEFHSAMEGLTSRTFGTEQTLVLCLTEAGSGALYPFACWEAPQGFLNIRRNDLYSISEIV